MILWAIQAQCLPATPEDFSLHCFSLTASNIISHFNSQELRGLLFFFPSVDFKMISHEMWSDENSV